jgi:DNA-binding CsgD family transcriptional regulator
MMDALERSVGFDAGYIAASWADSNDCRAAVLDHDAAFLEAHLDRFLSEISQPEVKAYADCAQNYEDVWPSARRRQLAVFNELLEPTRMRHMVVRVSCRHGNVAGVNLERRRHSSNFSDRDRAIVDLITPFLHVAEQLTMATQDEQQVAAFALRFALTRRESEFAAMACRGLQNSDIALVFGVSPNTVRNTLARVFEKTQVSNRVELRHLVTQCSVQPAQGRTGPRQHMTSSFAMAVQVATRGEAPSAEHKSSHNIQYAWPRSFRR